MEETIKNKVYTYNIHCSSTEIHDSLRITLFKKHDAFVLYTIENLKNTNIMNTSKMCIVVLQTYGCVELWN